MLTKRPSGFRNPVQYVVKKGILPPVRECNCFVCGKQARHYHHVDYDKPMEVIPVCVKCHHAVHIGFAVNEETKPYFFRTTKQMSKEIKKCAASYGITQSELARIAVAYFIRNMPIITMAPEQPQTKKKVKR